jgi:enoyl-CoA hydratase
MLTRTTIDGVDLLRLEHGKANALDLELTSAIRKALAAEAGHEGPLVLTGTGSIFCAGVDLFRVVEGGRAYIEQFLPALDGLFFDLFRFPRPVVAAINGHAIAGGCLLACACDYRVLAEGSGRVGLPELNVGVAFPASAIEVLRGVVGSSRLPELLYFGRTYEPSDAARHGLVDEIAPADALMRRAVDVARELAARPAGSFTVTKLFLRAAAIERMRGASAELPGLIDTWASEPTLAAVRVYLEKTLKR